MKKKIIIRAEPKEIKHVMRYGVFEVAMKSNEFLGMNSSSMS